jgi:hypothetical protein
VKVRKLGRQCGMRIESSHFFATAASRALRLSSLFVIIS